MRCRSRCKLLRASRFPHPRHRDNFFRIHLTLISIKLAVCRQCQANWLHVLHVESLEHLCSHIFLVTPITTLFGTERYARICLVRSISFVAKGFPKSFFRLVIFFMSYPTINMSSTYNRRMRKSPPSYFFTKAL